MGKHHEGREVGNAGPKWWQDADAVRDEAAEVVRGHLLGEERTGRPSAPPRGRSSGRTPLVLEENEEARGGSGSGSRGKGVGGGERRGPGLEPNELAEIIERLRSDPMHAKNVPDDVLRDMTGFVVGRSKAWTLDDDEHYHQGGRVPPLREYLQR